MALNTQYMRNPDVVYILKMEYVSKINIFGLNMTVKSGLDFLFEILHARSELLLPSAKKICPRKAELAWQVKVQVF